MPRKGTPYAHRAWKTIRLMVLQRDDHKCQIRGPGCTGVATDCDHIVPFSAGGAPFDLANLRAACAHCNRGHRDKPAVFQAGPSRDW